MRPLAWPMALLAAVVGGGGGVILIDALSAQDATPAARDERLGCTGDFHPIADVVDLVVSSAATPVPSVDLVAEHELPQGAPADEATVAAVEDVVQTWVTCMSTHQMARAFALMSDDLRRAMAPAVIRPGVQAPEEIELWLRHHLGLPPALSGAQFGTWLIGPGRDIRILEDGRVGGIWEVAGNGAFIILVREGDTFLVDDVIDIIEDATPAPET